MIYYIVYGSNMSHTVTHLTILQTKLSHARDSQPRNTNRTHLLTLQAATICWASDSLSHHLLASLFFTIKVNGD